MSTIINRAKNYIINGSFDFWQRLGSYKIVTTGPQYFETYGTATLGVFSSPSGYCADRFSFSSLVPANYKIFRSPEVPSYKDSKNIFRHSHVISIITPTTTLAPKEATTLTHKIEGVYAKFLYGKKATLSFWVMATQPGLYPVSFKNVGSRSYVTTFEVKNINVWERKVITLTLDEGDFWNCGIDLGLSINWSLASGTNFHAPSLNQWLNGDYLSHASCVNGIGSGSGNFTLAGIQLEEGDSASPFCPAGGGYAEELGLCQRYFEKSAAIEDTYQRSAIVHRVPGFDGRHSVSFQTRKRIRTVKVDTYTDSYYIKGAVTHYDFINGGTARDRIADVTTVTDCGFTLSIQSYSTNFALLYSWTADAEL